MRKRFLAISIVCFMVCIGILFAMDVFALGNNNNSNVNGQNQQQGQAQGQGQAQSMLNKINNKNINLNAVLTKITSVNKNTNVNANLNANKAENKNNQNITFEDKREYVQTPHVVFATAPQGFNEKKSKGRRHVSVADQTLFTKTWTKVRCKRMLSGNKFATKTETSPFVKKGDYEPTTEITIVTGDLNTEKYKEIAISIGQAKGDSNSMLVTAEAMLDGMELGADTIYIFDTVIERWFKHRGIGSGGSIADATENPDTVVSGLTSFNLGSQRYEKYPAQKMYLLKTVK